VSAATSNLCELRQGDSFQLIDSRGVTHNHLAYLSHDARGVTYTAVTNDASVQIVHRLWTDVRSVIRDVSGDVSRIFPKKP